MTVDIFIFRPIVVFWRAFVFRCSNVLHARVHKRNKELSRNT
jgi:hypothetical protein